MSEGDHAGLNLVFHNWDRSTAAIGHTHIGMSKRVFRGMYSWALWAPHAMTKACRTGGQGLLVCLLEYQSTPLLAWRAAIALLHKKMHRVRVISGIGQYSVPATDLTIDRAGREGHIGLGCDETPEEPPSSGRAGSSGSCSLS